LKRLLGSFYARISAVYLLLILALGAAVVAITFDSAAHVFDDVEQLLNRDYARAIAGEIQPLVADGFSQARVADAIHYMMVLNPMVEIYLLAGDGRILAWFAAPGERIVRPSVNLAPVNAFVSRGGKVPVRGDDPRTASRSKPFSAATLRMGPDQGYVYVILRGQRYDTSLRALRDTYYLRAGLAALVLALFSALLLGLSLFFVITRRLRALADAVRAFERGELARRVRVGGADEIGALGRSFNEMAATIERNVEDLRLAERMREELVTNVSHDLRSPLASIRGYLETLIFKDARIEATERRRFLDITLKSASRLEKLVSDLFDLVMLDNRQVKPAREPLQLAELAQDVVLKLEPRAQASGVSLRADLPGDLPLVSADAAMIERVLTNLIENALRFTPPGGSVTVALAAAAGAVRVSVSDTGEGIRPEDLARIFDRFYSADRSRARAGGGTGLGLSIARGIVELHGGALEARSALGQGTQFLFELRASSEVAAPS
jgi:signal transduction histidine kinase